MFENKILKMDRDFYEILREKNDYLRNHDRWCVT